MVRARIWLADPGDTNMPLVAGARVGPYEIQSILGMVVVQNWLEELNQRVPAR